MITCPHCLSPETQVYKTTAKCLACKAAWDPLTYVASAVVLPKLDPKSAMLLAQQSFADSGAVTYATKNAAPPPYVTMTAANLLKFFKLATESYQP